MKYITDRIEWTAAMKSYTENIIEQQLQRLIPEIDYEVKLSYLNKKTLKIDLCVANFRVQATDGDFYKAVKKAADKLQKIILKQKEKQKAHKQMSIYDLGIADYESDVITKEKIFTLAPMNIYEAIDAFENTDYPFYVFKDVDDANNIAIIYRRHKDTFGIIRTR